MGCLHEDNIWEEYLISLRCLDFISTWCAYFGVVLRCTCVINDVHRVVGGWVPSTVVTFISVLVKFF